MYIYIYIHISYIHIGCVFVYLLATPTGSQSAGPTIRACGKGKSQPAGSDACYVLEDGRGLTAETEVWRVIAVDMAGDKLPPERERERKIERKIETERGRERERGRDREREREDRDVDLRIEGTGQSPH